jgi:hypothetical protein
MRQILTCTTSILFLLFFFSQQGISQDRIILISGDTIKCTITKVTGKHVIYRQNFDGVLAKGKILKGSIREFSYFIEQEKPEPELMPSDWFSKEQENLTNPLPAVSNQEKVRFSVNGGPAYLLGNSETAEQVLQDKGISVEDSKSYYSDLKLGYQAKSSVYIHVAGDYWLGAQYHGFYTTSEITVPMQLDDTYIYYGRTGERFFVNFAGPSLFSLTRYGSSKKFGVNSSFTIGPAFYRNEAEMLNEQVLVKGNALATNLTLGLEYFIQPHISLSLESSLFSARLKKITVTSAQSTYDIKLEKENYENLGRLDLSLGFIFYW